MDPKNIKNRILDASDDDPNIHAIYHTGSDEGIDYYLVLATKQYEGREMLKLRYFAAHQTDAGDDTWMRNGITARTSDALLRALVEDLGNLESGLTDDPDMTRLRDLSGVIP